MSPRNPRITPDNTPFAIKIQSGLLIRGLRGVPLCSRLITFRLRILENFPLACFLCNITIRKETS